MEAGSGALGYGVIGIFPRGIPNVPVSPVSKGSVIIAGLVEIGNV